MPRRCSTPYHGLLLLSLSLLLLALLAPGCLAQYQRSCYNPRLPQSCWAYSCPLASRCVNCIGGAPVCTADPPTNGPNSGGGGSSGPSLSNTAIYCVIFIGGPALIFLCAILKLVVQRQLVPRVQNSLRPWRVRREMRRRELERASAPVAPAVREPIELLQVKQARAEAEPQRHVAIRAPQLTPLAALVLAQAQARLREARQQQASAMADSPRAPPAQPSCAAQSVPIAHVAGAPYEQLQQPPPPYSVAEAPPDYALSSGPPAYTDEQPRNDLYQPRETLPMAEYVEAQQLPNISWAAGDGQPGQQPMRSTLYDEPSSCLPPQK